MQLQFHKLLSLQLFINKINLNCINFINNLLVFVLTDFRKISFLIKIQTLFVKCLFYSCTLWERGIHRLLNLVPWEEDGSEGNITEVYKYLMAESKESAFRLPLVLCSERNKDNGH